MLSRDEYLKSKVTVQSLNGLIATTRKKSDATDDLFQQVIQLVRVSGLRPGRENVLVEQLNDLEHQTKRFIQDLNDSLAKSQENQEKQVIELKTSETQLIEATCQLKVQQNELKEQELKLKAQDDTIKVQELQLKDTNEKLKAQDLKLKALELKLKDTNEKYQELEEKYTIQAADIQDNQAVDDLIQRLEREYRIILRKRAEEMKKSREQSLELQEEIRQLRIEKNGLQGIIRQVREQYEEAHRNEIDYGSDAAHMKGLYENLLKAFREQQNSYSDRLSQVEKLHQDQMLRQKRQKQLELEEVEAKVKFTIDKKDKVINALQSKLKQQENVLNEFETLI